MTGPGSRSARSRWTQGGHPALPRQILKAKRNRSIVEDFANPLQRGATCPSREPLMLKATEEEIEEVWEYFEWQAPDLEVIFMQKVYSEAVLNTRHDVWDIHTNKDRWWVITGGTNLYSQQQFPNMDLPLTFHIGLMLRIPRTEEQQEDDLRIFPFSRAFEKMEEAGTAVTQAHNLADYQAVGVRCREALLELIGVAQDSAIWTDTPHQRSNC